MDAYIVSARKYRPSTFRSVVGQKALTTTLKNAIESGKLAHAYLFCGPRGVGKTTCARIFAKTINCTNPTAEGEACNECESCRSFNEQRSLNIHELDAASNNSVEDIRSLIDQVRIPPQIGRYKVYIIDEVHMLSQAAFNAFLKTLEEPPHHAIFILATTEKHKILPTILSRCQIYDFSRITTQDIVDHLQYVAGQEGITAEPEALNVIAQKADGGMRDALSIFDQVVSFTGGDIRYQSVIENLNVLDYEYYFRLTDCLLACRVSDALLTLNDILNKGFDGQHFVSGLAAHFRDLLVSHDAATLPLLEVGASIRTRYQQQAQQCPVPFLYKALKLCNDCDLNYRISRNKRLLIELTLIQIAQLSQPDADDVGSGHGPKQTLKPLFNQAEPAPTTTASATPAGQRPTAPQQEVPQQAAPQQAVSPARQAVPTPSAAKPAQPRAPQTERKIPTLKSGLHISITRVPQTDAQEQKPTEAKQPSRAENEEDFIFNEKDLTYYWREYASLLPPEEKATAGRMMNINPQLTNTTTFEVVVDNEMVEKLMQRCKADILTYLRKQLHNRTIDMNVRVSAPAEMVRAYSRVERFQLMNQKNPELMRLKQEFGLELY
ncbi:MAG: DNA polymerase III subunit gamma/tau [Bacteroidaceae bacterium]